MPRLYSPLERQLALQRLTQWVDSSRHAGDRERVLEIFMSALDGAAPKETISRGLKNINIQALVSGWLFADAPIGDGPCAALGLLSSSKGAKLPPGSRRFLEIYGASTLDVYEVLAVEPGHSCTLRQIPGGDECQVFERRGTERLAAGDILGARVMQGGDGQLVFEDVMILPGDRVEAEEHLQDLAEAGPDAFVLSKLLAPMFARWWFEGTYGEPDEETLAPLVMNGEVYEPGISTYILPRGAHGLDALASIPGMEEAEPGVWNLHEACEQDRRRLVGTVILEGLSGLGRTVELQAPGRESMKRLRKALRYALGKGIFHFRTTYEDPRLVPAERSIVESYQTLIDAEALGVDLEAPDAKEQISRAVRQMHLDRWPDMPLPALDNATPRQAARDPTRRPAVVRLLRGYEDSDAALAERDGVEPLDFTSIWVGLGLR